MNSNVNSNNQFVRGWSWGDLKVKNNSIHFEATNQQWFSIPYTNVTNVLQSNKNEIGLELNLDDEGGNFE
jgi:hypothetical protein